MNQENGNQVVTPENNTNQTPVAAPTEAQNTVAKPPVEPAPAPVAEPIPAAPAPAPQVESNQPKVQDEVIYKIKEEKGGNILGVIIFFAIMFAALYYLPNISDYAGKYIPGLNKNTNTPSTPTPDKEEKNKTDQDQEDNLLDLNGFVSNASIGNLQLGNFVKDNNDGNNKLDFYILNNGDELFVFNDNTKFYLDLYEDNRYLSSSLVYSYSSIGSKQSINFSIILPADTYKKANKFKIVRKDKSDYNPVTLTKQEGEYKKLVCSFNNDTIEYYFIDKYLEIINETYTESISNPNYTQDLEKYRNEASKYTAIPSIDNNIIESTDGFTIKTRIELQNINDSDLQRLATYKYFSYHKEDKVVSFEMEALGYNCS